MLNQPTPSARQLLPALAVAALVAALFSALALTASAQAAPSSAPSVGKIGRGVATSERRQVRRHRSKHVAKPATNAPSGGSPSTGTSAGSGSGTSAPKIATAPAKPTTPSKPTTPTTPTAPSAPTTPTAPTSPVSPTGALLEAGFESGLANWNIAGVGEVVPTVTAATARTGANSCRVALSGSQNRSELILGGNGSDSTRGTAEFHEGSEYWYGFSINVKQMVYGKPGAHNLIMQFKSDGTGSPLFGLQLWDVGGRKGLWTGGPAQETNHGGERFLAPLSENAWHDIQIHFKASEVGAGFYEVFLDGKLVDSKTNVSMIVAGRGEAYIKDGLYRNGGTNPGTSELFLDAAKLGTSQAAVLPS